MEMYIFLFVHFPPFPYNCFEIKTKYPISTKLHHRKWALSLFSHATPTRWQIPLQRC